MKQMEVCIIGPDHPLWQDAFEAIAHRFDRVFGARIYDIPDYFIIALDSNNKIQACVSIVYAGDKVMDSELHLDRPVEAELSAYFNAPVKREYILEALCMASCNPIASVMVCDMLPLFTYMLGMRYVICTANDKMRRLLKMRKIDYIKLAKADALREEVDDIELGTYYDSNPHVIVCYGNPRSEVYMARMLNTHCHYPLANIVGRR